MSVLVSNSGPLIALSGIDRLDLLDSLFGKVFIPEEVAQECLAGGAAGSGVASFQKFEGFQVIQLPDPPNPLLTALLDIGESRAIELALQLQPSILLMDELRGRKVARNIYGIQVVGTGRVLIEAKRANLINAVLPLLAKIRANGYWLSDRITDEIIKQAGE